MEGGGGQGDRWIIVIGSVYWMGHLFCMLIALYLHGIYIYISISISLSLYLYIYIYIYISISIYLYTYIHIHIHIYIYIYVYLYNRINFTMKKMGKKRHSSSRYKPDGL